MRASQGPRATHACGGIGGEPRACTWGHDLSCSGCHGRPWSAAGNLEPSFMRMERAGLGNPRH
eukprot:4415504-Lingulodinium_polyedra.AAC.1